MANKVICDYEDLVAIADAVRDKTGSTDSMTLGGIATAVAEIEAGSGGGSGDSYTDALIDKTITEYSSGEVTSIGAYTFCNCYSLTSVSFPKATFIGAYAFERCYNLISANFPAATIIGYSAFTNCCNLISANFPAATTIGSYAFYYCSGLTTANFPAVTSIATYAFQYCTSLTSVSFPAATSIGACAFWNCSKLTSVSFPVVTSVGGNAFNACTKLTSFYLPGSSLCALANSNAFQLTPIASGTGYIYVPSSLVASYQAATNWAYYSTQILSIGATPPSSGDSGDSENTINFTIMGFSYQAESGMTWAEWCSSSYNEHGYYITDDGMLYDSTDVAIVDSNGGYVVSDDVIQDNGVYDLDISGEW